MEISTEENQNLLSAFYERVMKMVHARSDVSEQETLVVQ